MKREDLRYAAKGGMIGKGVGGDFVEAALAAARIIQPLFRAIARVAPTEFYHTVS